MAFVTNTFSKAESAGATLWGVPKEEMLVAQAHWQKIMADMDERGLKRKATEPVVIDLTSPKMTSSQPSTAKPREHGVVNLPSPEALERLRLRAECFAENYGKIYYVPAVPSLQTSLLNTPLRAWEDYNQSCSSPATPQPDVMKGSCDIEEYYRRKERQLYNYREARRNKRARKHDDDGLFESEKPQKIARRDKIESACRSNSEWYRPSNSGSDTMRKGYDGTKSYWYRKERETKYERR
ncbi:hypothetical protein HD806DRAFT_532897 [Xylariaceae sp. AK1471]|nr:hypothetical protein HD806DRAFT_532897 [Xylariaceae sp. AK1471]